MQVQEGKGWRLLVDPARCPFVVLVGGEGWAVELSRAEALALATGVSRLVTQHQSLADQLMAEEAIGLDWEQGDLWVALEGDRQLWSLRFVLSPATGQRAVEGAWGPPASAALAAALETLWSFLAESS